MSQEQRETVLTSRKSLKTLQSTSSNVENLVGRMPKSLKQLSDNGSSTPKSLKHQISDDSSAEIEIKKKTSQSHKETQASFTNKITANDLTTPGEPSLNYWKTLATTRQKLLDDSLQEIGRLKKRVCELESELTTTKVMLDEANALVQIVQEITSTDNDDTGIDVNDVSTADDTINDDGKSLV